MLPSLVADMNIAVKVVKYLYDKGINIVSARELGWGNYTDSQILANAYSMGRFVITHDADFGNLAVFRREPILGIIYLRPGGRKADEVISDIDFLINANIDWTRPAIVVYREGKLRIRQILPVLSQHRQSH